MPTQTTVLQVYSLQAVKPTTYYGRPSTMPLRGGAGTGRAVAVFRPDLSKIPRNAVITDAYVDIRLAAAASGSRTMTLQTKPTALPSRPTWGNYGALGPQVATHTRGSLVNGSQFKLPVTATIQAMVKGTQPNNGFRLELSDTTAIKIRGTAATGGRPALVVSYVVLPVAPTGLTPSGSAISSARPTLMFAAAADITKLQIQVDPTGNGSAPQFNSGEVAATGGLLDLSAPAWAAFPPLAVGETRLWRARQSNTAGWSPWSGWTTVSRIPTGVLDITQPPGDPDPDEDGILVPVPIDDGTPPVTWVYTPPDGATQTAWRGRLYDAANNVLADSGRTLGTDAEWTPNKGLTRNGQQGTLTIEVWDNTDRVATPGDPVSVIASKPVVLAASGTVAPVASLVGRVGSWVPDVTLTATRAAIPDFLALVRDDEEIARWAGLDVFTPGPTVTNYVHDPSTNDGTITPWAPYGLNTTVSSVIEDGRAAIKAEKTAVANSCGIRNIGVNNGLSLRPAGTQVTVSAWVKNPSGSSVTGVSLICRDDTNGDSSVLVNITAGALQNTVAADGVWRRIYATGTVKNARNLEAIYAAKTASNLPIGENLLIRDVMVTDGPLIDFFDGDTPDTDDYTYAWTGTPSNSASTRTGRATATIVDPAATMNTEHTWQLVPIVNGKKSLGGPVFTGTPRCFGIWLAEADAYFPSPATPDVVQDLTRRVVLWGGADQEQTQPEAAIIHQPLPATLSGSGTAAPVIRRRLLRSAPQGALSGTIIYVGDATPTEPLPSPERVEELLREWADADAGTRYLLTLGNFTGEVILGDITLIETPVQQPERQLAASMNWWAQ